MFLQYRRCSFFLLQSLGSTHVKGLSVLGMHFCYYVYVVSTYYLFFFQRLHFLIHKINIDIYQFHAGV